MKLLIGLSFLFSVVSCNLIQAIGGGETKIGKTGGGPVGGFEPYYFFLDTASGPYMIKTKDDDYALLDGSVSAAEYFTYYGNAIYFKAIQGGDAIVFGFDLYNQSVTPVQNTGTIYGITEFHGKLYFLEGTNGLCHTDSLTTAPSCVSTDTSMANGFTNARSVDKLYTCYNGAIYFINESDGTISAPDPGGAATYAQCNGVNYHDGKNIFFTGGDIRVYDFMSNTETVYSVGSTQQRGIGRSGRVYFEASGPSLQSLNLADGNIETLLNIGVSANVLEGRDEIFYTYFDANTSSVQIYRKAFSDVSNGQQISDLSGISSDYHLSPGDRSFYLTHAGGVEKVYGDGATETIFSGSVSGNIGEAHGPR